MSVLYYVVLVIFGLFGTIHFVFRISKSEKKQILDELLENKEISAETYIKYSKK